jgi:hypothetical protein
MVASLEELMLLFQPLRGGGETLKFASMNQGMTLRARQNFWSEFVGAGFAVARHDGRHGRSLHGSVKSRH